MNERIKLLAEQAEVYYSDGEYREEDLAALQKFAELIIQECIKRIKGCAVDNPKSDEFVSGYNKGVSKVASQVKYHFGVEE